jgi:hypothetical protein
MSKRVKITKLKELIKHLVVQELKKDDEIEEVSTTASAGIDGTGTGHYDTPHAFSSGSAVGHKSPEVGGYKKVNESQPFADFTELPKLNKDQQESLDELFGFAESYQIYNAFEKDPKKFIKTLDDMAKIRKASNKKPKGVNFNKSKKQFVKEIANQEISALQNLEKGLDKLRKDYVKIMSIGDKTLKNKQYNDYYDYILNAQKGIGSLTQTLKRKQMLGEGRYHDWRNDESMTPKQKVGRSMREIRDALNELDRTVKMNLKLKTELKMKSEDYWKNTHKALTKISERLVKMANKIGNLK